MIEKTIPIFFSADDNYVPFLAVAIRSLIDNASKKYNYDIVVLNSGLTDENMKRIKKMEEEKFNIKFVDVNPKIENITSKLTSRLRDYYSISIYYRLFIPSLFPAYNKVIYLDADVVLVDDISKLYFEDINDYLVGGIPDEVIAGDKIFQDYTKYALDLEPGRYFNSGVLLMNLDKFREEKIEEKFLYLLDKYNFDTVAPDQDYLNVLCKDKVKYVDRGWDRMPNVDETFDDSHLHLIHFNMFQKPWKYEGVLYQEYFWEYAKKTDFIEEIYEIKNKYTDEDRKKDMLGGENLLKQCEKIVASDFTFKKVLGKNYFNFM